MSTLQKTEILRRQAFKCVQCQTDLEPVGSAPPRFQFVERVTTGASSNATNVQAFCPACHATNTASESPKASEKKRRLRESGPAKSAKKFVKSGFDAQKF